MVGSLVEVGRGKEGRHWIAEILKAADRTHVDPSRRRRGCILKAWAMLR